ncbi:MAG: hypothetical protein C0467_09755 [Planctomycetaceae bacterium]|nr:hypothetical protein [Planctomycetaceae bacterium]
MATWTCPQDGTENPLAEKRCLVCRHPNMPRIVVLQSVATRKEAEFTEPVKLGKAVFTHRFADPDARFASDLQFEIVRDDERVAWVVRPFAGCVNPTCYDGKPLEASGTELVDGGIISVSKSKMKLKVRFKKN